MLSHRGFRRILALSSIAILVFKFPSPSTITKLTSSQTGRTNISQACKIPELDVYHKTIKHFIRPPQDPQCLKAHRKPLFFKSTLDSELVPAAPLTTFYANNIRSCCYRTITRDNKDFGYKLSKLCHPVSIESKTKVRPSHEYVAIFCMNKTGSLDASLIPINHSEFVDIHAFVPLKPQVESRLHSITASGDRPNIILFGLDAVSRTNFLRWLPKSHKFLVEKMGAIDMRGFNKIAHNTLKNIAALLTSRTLANLSSTCVNKKHEVDDCQFLWKDYARKGYRTVFDEDSTWGIFVFGGYYGFKTQPTDYYLRTFYHVSDYYFKKHQHQQWKKACGGPRLSFEELLSHMTKFIYKMNQLNKPFFYFSWESTLTHDKLNDAALVEKPFLKTLKWLHNNKQLTNTILIVFSDHGMRLGKMRSTRQGQMEDRLPLMYLVFPEWFKKTYSRAIDNLRGNQERLTTILDLNYALQDILDLDRIKEDELLRREQDLQKQFFMPESVKGISLFLPIPPERMCKHTIIDPEFCICTFYGSVDVQMKDVQAAVKAVIKDMNKNLSKYDDLCEKLELEEIKLAQLDLDKDYEKRYLINFQTKPGGAQFEVLVTNIKKGYNPSCTVIGTVLRTNLYGKQSACVDDLEMKPYCYCKDQGLIPLGKNISELLN